MVDRSMTFRERLEWLEEAETLALRLSGDAASRQGNAGGGSSPRASV